MSLSPFVQYPVQRIRRFKDGTDSLGNDRFTETTETVYVAGWGAPPGDEPKLAGHDRRTVRVEMYAPVGSFQHKDAVVLPGSAERLEVLGEPGNYEHNPFGWSPGLAVVNLGGIE
ncbi:hypothetical protein CMUST_15740 (plasmid) [Corynebacterium mustelae]|uniref:Head-to-tail stopper n=1 Tax=Corynebacterium mustelae TaxID=571915 RepID=A0A0G3H1Z4_9CORY|nr:hypothetical protein [Corynebacterium mustelae]AKK05238.1 hypothetical protein CMUST_04480 [Corynebacterium mustelae]AKK07436.1 hypothetical protein CMUST_15740 [Corynebacterium mustelae]